MGQGEGEQVSTETRFTPGPWRWELNQKSKRLQLCGGRPRYDLTVLDFVRWGMSGAAPRLRTGGDNLNIMVRADQFPKIVKGREHHADWFQTIDHPDALLIEAAPDLYDALQGLVNAITASEPLALTQALRIARAALNEAGG
jgi:hypothetical protein